MNSATLTPDHFLTLSDTVKELNTTPQLRGSEEGAIKSLRTSEWMSSIDRQVKRERQAGSDTNLTFLYEDGEGGDDDPLRIPSAVLVHDTLDETQLTNLRELLPPGIPIIDAETNELLDEVGKEEREASRARLHLHRRFGEFAVGNRGWDNDARQFNSLFDDIIAHSYPKTNESIFGNSGDNDDWDDDPSTYQTSNTSGTQFSTPNSVPESDEVREYRERTEQAVLERQGEKDREAAEGHKLVDDAAKEKFGRSLSELDDKQKVSLRREAVKKYHPDVATGEADSRKLRTFEQLLR